MNICQKQSYFSEFKPLPTTVNEVQNITNPLKQKNSYQYKLILQGYSNMYQTSFNCHLGYICNQSMDVTFPGRLKYSIAKCVFQKADYYCVYNYRPVSLYEVFNSKSTLQEWQLEFRKNLSTQPYIDSQMKSCALMNKISVGCYDLTKAFTQIMTFLCKLNYNNISSNCKMIIQRCW